MIGYVAVPLLLVLLQYGSFNPTPLDDLTINLKIKDSLRDVEDNELEADNNNPNIHAVIIGGVSEGGEPLKDVEIFANEWKPFLPELPTIRTSPAAYSLQNQLYVTGGLTSPDKHTAPDESAPVGLFTERDDTNPVTGVKWNNLPELNIPRHRHTATVIGPQVYVTGGWIGTGPTSSIEIYNSKSKKWEVGPNMKMERYEHAAVVYKGQLHVIGGRKNGVGHQGMKSVEVFEENSWKLQHKEKIMKKKIFSHVAVSLNDELFGDIIIVCGGRYIHRDQSSGQSYENYVSHCKHFDGDQWYEPNTIGNVVSPMKEIRAMFGMVVLNGRLWAFGGYNGQEALTSVESCPVDSNRNRVWTLAPKQFYLKKARMMFGVALYTAPQISNKKELVRKSESTLAINSTFV